MEVFMDDFFVFGSTFDHCLDTLVLQRCQDTNLVLNWEKCHFMVREGILLGHSVSSKGLEVDQAKITAIEQLPPPTNIKGIKSFLGHIGFYRIFIKDFSKVAKPLCNLLEKDVLFNFDENCVQAFNRLKEKLILAQYWWYLTGANHLKSCVMLVILHWEQFLCRDMKRSFEQFIMQVALRIVHNKTTPQLRKRC